MVCMENKGYSDMIGSPMRLSSTVWSTAGKLAQDYYGLTHPACRTTTGSSTGLTPASPTSAKVCIFDHGTLLTDNIDAAGLTWRGYAQSQPQGNPCRIRAITRVELPFVAFEGIGKR